MKLVRANKKLKDQEDKVILKGGEYYTVLETIGSLFKIVDENEKVIILAKNHFSNIKECEDC